VFCLGITDWDRMPSTDHSTGHSPYGTCECKWLEPVQSQSYFIMSDHASKILSAFANYDVCQFVSKRGPSSGPHSCPIGKNFCTRHEKLMITRDCAEALKQQELERKLLEEKIRMKNVQVANMRLADRNKRHLEREVERADGRYEATERRLPKSSKSFANSSQHKTEQTKNSRRSSRRSSKAEINSDSESDSDSDSYSSSSSSSSSSSRSPSPARRSSRSKHSRSKRAPSSKSDHSSRHHRSSLRRSSSVPPSGAPLPSDSLAILPAAPNPLMLASGSVHNSMQPLRISSHASLHNSQASVRSSHSARSYRSVCDDVDDMTNSFASASLSTPSSTLRYAQQTVITYDSDEMAE